LDNKDSIARIEKNLENVNNLALSNAKSNKTFNQTFMYLAEWVDSASENLSSIIEKVDGLDGVKKSVDDLKKTMPKKTDLETVFEKISKKFDKQQEKIKSLEEKIDKLSKVKEKTKEVDIKAIVAEVVSQMAKPEVVTDAKMTKKVDNIDKQLAKLSKNIEKLSSYVE